MVVVTKLIGLNLHGGATREAWPHWLRVQTQLESHISRKQKILSTLRASTPRPASLPSLSLLSAGSLSDPPPTLSFDTPLTHPHPDPRRRPQPPPHVAPRSPHARSPTPANRTPAPTRRLQPRLAAPRSAAPPSTRLSPAFPLHRQPAPLPSSPHLSPHHARTPLHPRTPPAPRPQVTTPR
ncbi:hypothetical protein BU15DRAFT_83834 [Melanogaster broomeanus]|nr:hypothetical protein BU15DRAFT_83834 [Melanogaster broomeanus]